MSEAPSKTLPVSPPTTSSSFLHWIGPCASILCLIHCFGTAVLAIAAPGLLKMLPHSEWVEFIFLGVSYVFGSLTLRRQKSSLPLQAFMAGVALVGATGWSLYIHEILYAALLILGLIPFVLLVLKHRASRRKPPCCAEHDRTHP